jgi:hypothetical protein
LETNPLQQTGEKKLRPPIDEVYNYDKGLEMRQQSQLDGVSGLPGGCRPPIYLADDDRYDFRDGTAQ